MMVLRERKWDSVFFLAKHTDQEQKESQAAGYFFRLTFLRKTVCFSGPKKQAPFYRITFSIPIFMVLFIAEKRDIVEVYVMDLLY